MFENDHMDEFDLQVRSVLESGSEEVPQGVWDGVSAGLDKAARGKVVTLWLRRAGLSVAAAAAVVAGFIFIGKESPADIVVSDQEGMIAVVEDNDFLLEQPQGDDEFMVSPVKNAERICKSSVAVLPSDAQDNMDQQESFDGGSQEGSEIIQQPVADEQVSQKPVLAANSDAGVARQDEQQSSWVEEKPRTKRRINTSLVLSGIAGTNSPSASARTAIFRSPALDKAPSTTIVQQSGSVIAYGIPVSAGLGVKLNFTERWALSIGVNYSLLTSRFDGTYIEVDKAVIVSEKSAHIRNMQHYVGVPLNAYYNILRGHFVNFYAYAGGTVEKCVLNKYQVQTDPVIYHTQSANGLQISANAGIGVEFALGKHVGIYIDPSLRYYFKGSQPESIRTAQPLMLGFEAGLRFNL